MSYTTTKMDKFVADTIKEVLTNGVKSEGGRPVYKSDGAPAESYYITDVFVKFDLSKGELPITSLRPVYTGLARQELLWIYSDQTSDLKALRKRGVFWWDDFKNPFEFTGERYVLEIPIKKVESKEYEIDDIGISAEDVESWEKIGEKTYLKKGKKRVYCIYQHKEKKYLLEVRKDSSFSPKACCYARTVAGVGYRGESETSSDDLLYKLWYNMMYRVYTKDWKKSHQDVYVSTRWHNFSNFEKDIQEIPNFKKAMEEKLVGWDLDKDYFGAKVYSKDTCLFLRQEENRRYAGVPIVAQTGKVKKYFLSIRDCAEYFDINEKSLAKKIRNGKKVVINGFEIRKYISKTHVLRLYNPNFYGDNIGLRYGATVNKHKIIDRLLEGLEKNPYNRRNIINLWQYEDLDTPAALPPCAFEVLFDVRKVNGEIYLDASLTQRSNDFVIAGLGINQIQYVALQMMVAKHFGWKVGTFSWHVMNLHIYDRHIDNAKILLERYNTSTLDNSPIEFYLDVPDGTNFYDIKAEDFKMKGYKAISPQLEFDMAL